MATYYSEEHEWLTVEGDTATLGITKHAAEQLGDVVFVEQQEAGDEFEKGGEIGVIESVKAASELYAPVDGEIVEVNEALADKVIGAQSGTTQADYIEAAYPDADIRLYPTQDEVNLDMASGRIDLQVGDMLPMLDWTAKSDDGSCCELAGAPITDPAFVGEGVGIAVRQEDDALREKLNAALAEIRADGTYKAINDKYFDIDVYTMK